MGLNHSVYVSILLKTKFDMIYCALLILFVLDNVKCPGVTLNHELINLVKTLHIRARMGSQMSVVTIYGRISVDQMVIQSMS